MANKTEIFNAAFVRALREVEDVRCELDGFDSPLSLRTVMHEMIRHEVQNILYEEYFSDEEYERWCESPNCLAMYNDLWKWIDHACPFGIEDQDAVEILGFSDIDWTRI